MPEPVTPILMWLLLLPLLGGLLLPIVKLGNDDNVRRAALGVSLMTFGVSLLIAWNFKWTGVTLSQMPYSIQWVRAFGLNFSLGAQPIGMWLLLLTTFLMPLVILGSFGDITKRVREFYMWLLLLEAAMLGVFVARDLIFFYISFEFTLVPLFFLIGIYGGAKRLKAAKVFFLYTFTGSMFTFAGILFVAWWHHNTHQGSWTFDIDTLIASAQTMPVQTQTWVLLAMLAGFAVKVPLFPLHTWLPLAHTEAPTSGSVILAGVLLKLGTYALLILAIPMAPDAVVKLGPYIGGAAVIGILYTALICWVQTDIKKLIAYSSVSHLGFCVMGMFALNVIGMTGSVLYMINHGLSTGALFLCVGMIYQRLHTREMDQIGGLAKIMPIWAFFMVFFCLASVGLPGLNGFPGEFLTLLGAFTSEATLGPKYAIVAGFGMIFTAIYILYMVGKVVWGEVKLPEQHKVDIHDLRPREIAVLAPIAVACLVLGLYPKPVLRSLGAPVRALVANVQPDTPNAPLALKPGHSAAPPRFCVSTTDLP